MNLRITINRGRREEEEKQNENDEKVEECIGGIIISPRLTHGTT